MLKTQTLRALVPMLRQPLKLSLVLLLFNGCLFSIPVVSAPAPWFLWQSRVDGTYLCIQTTPGDGWIKISGPYRKAQCHRVIRVLLLELKD